MRTRKPQKDTETPTERRLAQVAIALGLGRELPQAWVAQRAGIPRSTLQNAGIRDSLSHDLARKIAGLMVGDEAKLIKWLMGETPDTPSGAEMAPRMPQDERPGDEPTAVPSSDESQPEVPSASVRPQLVEAQSLEKLRVLADRIARAVRETIVGNEVGYTPRTRRMLADSLEVFANDLDERCGSTVAVDIWKVVAWLRKSG